MKSIENVTVHLTKPVKQAVDAHSKQETENHRDDKEIMRMKGFCGFSKENVEKAVNAILERKRALIKQLQVAVDENNHQKEERIRACLTEYDYIMEILESN